MQNMVYNPQWYEQQRQTIELLGTKNSQKANRKGFPNHDTPRAIARRAWLRKVRYEIESEGFLVFCRRMWKSEKNSHLK